MENFAFPFGNHCLLQGKYKTSRRKSWLKNFLSRKTTVVSKESSCLVVFLDIQNEEDWLDNLKALSLWSCKKKITILLARAVDKDKFKGNWTVLWGQKPESIADWLADPLNGHVLESIIDAFSGKKMFLNCLIISQIKESLEIAIDEWCKLSTKERFIANAFCLFSTAVKMENIPSLVFPNWIKSFAPDSQMTFMNTISPYLDECTSEVTWNSMEINGSRYSFGINAAGIGLLWVPFKKVSTIGTIEIDGSAIQVEFQHDTLIDRLLYWNLLSIYFNALPAMTDMNELSEIRFRLHLYAVELKRINDDSLIDFWKTVKQLYEKVEDELMDNDLRRLSNVVPFDPQNRRMKRYLHATAISSAKTFVTQANKIENFVSTLDEEELKNEFGENNQTFSCVFSSMDLVETILAGDCICLGLDIRRKTGAIRDPSTLKIVAIHPTFVSSDTFFDILSYSLKHKDPLEVHGGFVVEGGRKPMVISGVARESITGVLPLFINQKHWQIAKEKMKPLLAWMCTLSSASFKFKQLKTVPFLVLFKAVKNFNDEPTEFKKNQLSWVLETCMAVSKELRRDDLLESISDLLDFISGKKVLGYGQLICILGLLGCLSDTFEKTELLSLQNKFIDSFVNIRLCSIVRHRPWALSDLFTGEPILKNHEEITIDDLEYSPLLYKTVKYAEKSLLNDLNLLSRYLGWLFDNKSLFDTSSIDHPFFKYSDKTKTFIIAIQVLKMNFNISVHECPNEIIPFTEVHIKPWTGIIVNSIGRTSKAPLKYLEFAKAATSEEAYYVLSKYCVHQGAIAKFVLALQEGTAVYPFLHPDPHVRWEKLTMLITLHYRGNPIFNAETWWRPCKKNVTKVFNGIFDPTASSLEEWKCLFPNFEDHLDLLYIKKFMMD